VNNNSGDEAGRRLARMMGATTTPVECLEYIEVDPTGQYGRVQYVSPPPSQLIYYYLLDPFACQSTDLFVGSSAMLCSSMTFLARARPRPCKIRCSFLKSDGATLLCSARGRSVELFVAMD
jgi:hypothetical protein